ncbi:MAG: hypothetical protein NC223_11325 [Butyrivibrio sp.]|nr:hypothetical protein [Butyrivibrio sp.]
MKKSIFSKAAAAVMAGAMVLGMAVTAFAGGAITSDIPNSADDGGGNYQVKIVEEGKVQSNYEGLDVTKVASFDITFSYEIAEDGWMGGAIVSQSTTASWNSFGQWTTADEAKEFANVKSGTPIRVDLGENKFTADDEYIYITIQNYGDAAMKIDSLVFYDADGNVIPAAGGGATDTPSGDSAATVVLILAAVASLAVVATVSVKKFAVER